MEGVTLVARLTAKPGFETQLKQQLQTVASATHAEAGCVRYAIHEDLNDPAIVVIVERWASNADLDQHIASDHVKAFLEALPNWTNSDPEVSLLRLIDHGTSEKGAL